MINAATTASEMRDGPDWTMMTMPTTVIATVAANARVRPFDIRDTSQPTAVMATGARAISTRRNHSRGEGLPSMTTSLPSVTKRTGNVQQCSVAYAAKTGADRDQSRRHRPRIVNTDGRPRCRNQLSASSVADPRRASERRKGLMPGHTSAGRFAALSW
jgi:hypothetical protein